MKPALIVTITFNTRLAQGTRLRLLPHNAILLPTDYVTSRRLKPGEGLVPLNLSTTIYWAGKRPSDTSLLAFYRILS